MQPDTKLADLYEKTAEVLETEGWIQGYFHSTKGYCVIGGMYRASYLLAPGYLDKVEDAACLLRKHLGVIGNLSHWNDFPGRQAHEVIDTFKDLAKDIRNAQ